MTEAESSNDFRFVDVLSTASVSNMFMNLCGPLSSDYYPIQNCIDFHIGKANTSFQQCVSFVSLAVRQWLMPIENACRLQGELADYERMERHESAEIMSGKTHEHSLIARCMGAHTAAMSKVQKKFRQEGPHRADC